MPLRCLGSAYATLVSAYMVKAKEYVCVTVLFLQIKANNKFYSLTQPYQGRPEVQKAR